MDVATSPHVHKFEPDEWRQRGSRVAGVRCRGECGVGVPYYERAPDGNVVHYLNAPQDDALSDYDSDEIYVGSGYGGGKTFALVIFMMLRLSANPPGTRGIIVEPNYPQVVRILEPEFRKWFKIYNWPWVHHQTHHYVTIPGDRGFWMLGAEDPDSLAGPTVAIIAMDEAAYIKERAYEILNTRLRAHAKITQLMAVSTHDGVNTWFARNMMAADEKIKRHVIRGTTHDNFANPEAYLRRLSVFKEGTPEHEMYVLGIPRSLQGNIYTAINAKTFRTCANPTAGQIVLGGDFNNRYMVTVVGRWLRDELHIWGEVITRGGNHGDATTRVHYQSVRDYLVRRGFAVLHDGYVKQISNREVITAYIDASSTAQKTSAQHTDHYLVQEIGFWPVHDSANPPIDDRVNSVQAALHDCRLYVDEVGAPVTAMALREHARDKRTGKPQKWSVHDDLRNVPLDAHTDSVGYMVWGLMPLRLGFSPGHHQRNRYGKRNQ